MKTKSRKRPEINKTASLNTFPFFIFSFLLLVLFFLLFFLIFVFLSRALFFLLSSMFLLALSGSGIFKFIATEIII